MIAAIASGLGLSPETATAIAGLGIIVLVLAGAMAISRYAGWLLPRVRGTAYTGAMIAAVLFWAVPDPAVTGIASGVFLAIFIALLAVRITVELTAPSPGRARSQAAGGQGDGGSGGYSPGPSGSGRRGHDDPGGDGHGGDGGGNGGGGGGDKSAIILNGHIFCHPAKAGPRSPEQWIGGTVRPPNLPYTGSPLSQG